MYPSAAVTEPARECEAGKLHATLHCTRRCQPVELCIPLRRCRYESPFPRCEAGKDVFALEDRAARKQASKQGRKLGITCYIRGLCGAGSVPVPLTALHQGLMARLKPPQSRPACRRASRQISRPGTTRAQARRLPPRASNTSAAPRPPLLPARSESGRKSGGRRAEGKN